MLHLAVHAAKLRFPRKERIFETQKRRYLRSNLGILRFCRAVHATLDVLRSHSTLYCPWLLMIPSSGWEKRQISILSMKGVLFLFHLKQLPSVWLSLSLWIRSWNRVLTPRHICISLDKSPAFASSFQDDLQGSTNVLWHSGPNVHPHCFQVSLYSLSLLAGVQPRWIQDDSKVGTESASLEKYIFNHKYREIRNG